MDPDDSDDEPLVKKCMLLPKRCQSGEAIQRRRRLYKIRKRNRQQKQFEITTETFEITTETFEKHHRILNIGN